MNSELQTLINNLTQDIIDIYKIDVPIVNIDNVVATLGGHIEEKSNFDDMSNGNIRKLNNGFIIYISPYQSVERRRFQIAQELGHLFLHMGYNINSDLWGRQENAAYYHASNPMDEYQANEFAAALLMPKMQYRKIMDRNTNGNIVETKKVAKYFGVSVSAASNRGKFLGYLQG